MEDSEDMRDHKERLFDAMDILINIAVSVNVELFPNIIWDSLSPSYSNFWCLMDTRDD